MIFFTGRFKLVFFFFVLNAYCVAGQENTIKDKNALEAKIKTINKKISESNNERKLFWLDSLCKLIQFNKTYNYEPIVRKTINLAIAKNSPDMAAYQTG